MKDHEDALMQDIQSRRIQSPVPPPPPTSDIYVVMIFGSATTITYPTLEDAEAGARKLAFKNPHAQVSLAKVISRFGMKVERTEL